MANIGYARCSTLAQDLTAQRQALAALGVPGDRIYLDKGLTGTSRARPGLDQALAAVREGDTLTVTKLDRLARSVQDALDILSHLSDRGVKFALGGSVYDWHDPFGRMFLQILAVIAEFEVNLLRQRTREGMAIAKQNGKLKGKQPKLKPAQDREIRRMHDSGDHNVTEVAALFNVSRPTVYRSLQRTATLPPLPADTRPAPDLAEYDQLLTEGRATRRLVTSPPVTRSLPAPERQAVQRGSQVGPNAADRTTRYANTCPRRRARASSSRMSQHCCKARPGPPTRARARRVHRRTRRKKRNTGRTMRGGACW